MSEPPDDVENPPNDLEEEDDGGENVVLIFPDPAIEDDARNLAAAAAVNPRRLAEERHFLVMQQTLFGRRVAATKKLEQRLRVAAGVGTLLFVAGLIYVVERGAAAVSAQTHADEAVLARSDWPAGYAWRLVAGAEFRPLPGQKRAPCAQDEMDSGGYCWSEIKHRPPCYTGSVEGNGHCYTPTPGAALDSDSGRAHGH